MTRLCDEGKLLVPTGWTALPSYIGQSSGWKIAECIRFLGDQGLYILGLLVFKDPHIKELFLDLLQILDKMISHDISDHDLKAQHKALVLVLAKLEGHNIT